MCHKIFTIVTIYTQIQYIPQKNAKNDLDWQYNWEVYNKKKLDLMYD